MAPSSSSSSYPSALAAMRRGARSKGGLATIGIVVAVLVAVLGAFSSKYDAAFAAATPSAPAPPKKPGSGYILWFTSRRPSLVKERPEDTVTQIAKVLGAEWRALPDAQKASWNKKAADLLGKYKQEVEAWKEKYGELPKKKKRAKPGTKVAKGSPNPYALFVKANAKTVIAEAGATKVTEVSAELARRWKALTAAQKKPFLEEAAKARAAFEASRPELVKKQAKQATSAYAFFVKANAKKLMAEAKASKVTEVAAELGRRWKALTDAQKKPFLEEAAQAKAAFEASRPAKPEAAKTKASPAKPKAKAKAKAAPKAAAAPKAKAKAKAAKA